MQPWEKPCGTPLGEPFKMTSPRHGAHRSLKRVKTQLKVAQNHFRKDKHDIERVYSEVYKVLKKQYNLTWLPKNQLQWYYNELWCVEKGKKAEYALPRLHEALQKFAITFDSLKNFNLKSGINVEWAIIKRNDIISAMENEVLRTLCEVETAIMNLGHQVPATYKAKVLTDSPAWATEGDLTLMLIQDWGVLRLYRAFLNDWIRAFRNATAKGPGTCDSNTVKPLIFKSKKKYKNQKKIIRQKRPMKKKNHNEKLKEKISDESNKKMLQAKKRELRRRLIQNRRRKII